MPPTYLLQNHQFGHFQCPERCSYSPFVSTAPNAVPTLLTNIHIGLRSPLAANASSVFATDIASRRAGERHELALFALCLHAAPRIAEAEEILGVRLHLNVPGRDERGSLAEEFLGDDGHRADGGVRRLLVDVLGETSLVQLRESGVLVVELAEERHVESWMRGHVEVLGEDEDVVGVIAITGARSSGDHRDDGREEDEEKFEVHFRVFRDDVGLRIRWRMLGDGSCGRWGVVGKWMGEGVCLVRYVTRLVVGTANQLYIHLADLFFKSPECYGR
jgi:hypothetical protein